MVTFIFNNVKELAEWRENFIKEFNEVPRITAKIVNKECTFLARVNM